MGDVISLLSLLSYVVFSVVSLSQIRPCSSLCYDPENSTIAESQTIFKDCNNGKCVRGVCECNQGWKGDYCDECGGRLLLTEDTGFVSDGVKDYAKERECSWLIRPKSYQSGDIIRLRFLEFASECGWDYLYVYDGDSVISPILATFNGLITISDADEDLSEKFLPEVVARSGSVFIHFFSDVEYFMKGFNISYSLESCPQHCSNHGSCIDSSLGPTCQCNSTWSGSACERFSCPANCSYDSNQGYCANSNSSSFCECESGFQGVDCSSNIPAKQGFWQEAAASVNPFNLAKASHTAVIRDNDMWSYGGIQFGALRDYDAFHVYNFSSGDWKEIITNSTIVPSTRYGHSMVHYQNKFIMFGGRDVWTDEVKSEVWEYDPQDNSWSNITYTVNFIDESYNSTISPLSLWGHSATLVDFENGTSMMLVMFGIHPVFEFSGFVFEYDIVNKTWSEVVTNGAAIESAYGHSTTWDPVNRICYVHGGIVFLKENSYGITDATYFYNPKTRNFQVLRPSGVPRYLHSSVLIDGVLFTYGGCTHNDSNESTGALCFSPSFMAYHIACDTWEHLSSPDVTYYPSRFGHSAVSVNIHENQTENMAIYGGYDSTMLDNILMFQVGSCSYYSKNETTCSGSHHIGLSCTWTGGDCVPAKVSVVSNSLNSSCQNLADSSYCDKLSSPASCLNSVKCGLRSGGKCHERTNSSAGNTTDTDMETYCNRFRTCGQCDLNSHCQWVNNKCTVKKNNETSSCIETCGSTNNCKDCAAIKSCMWCVNKGLCLSTTTYVAQFTYGECMKWVNSKAQCATSGSCTDLRTCDACHSDPFCGWCDNGSETGLGMCQSGSGQGSRTSNTSENVISGGKLVRYNTSVPECPKKGWYFTNCPLCQCNGHSKCFNGTSECIECMDNTTGEQCEQCVDGYFGYATNGGTCTECDCGDRATLCNNETGNCFCHTKGEIGPKCMECDTSSRYYGDTADNGTCYYRLQINYAYTFTLNLVQDRYVTEINFENTPQLVYNTILNFEAKELCDVKLTVYRLRPIELQNSTGNSSDQIIEYVGQEIDVAQQSRVSKFEYEFSGNRYGFGDSTANVTIRIYVSNFTVPTWIQVSLVQRNNSILLILLILFSVFLILLLLTAVGWKLKLTYSQWQIRRQRAEQLEQMAARPYSTVHLCLDDIHSAKKSSDESDTYVYPSEASAVCEELCADNRTAVVSVVMWMPANNAANISCSTSSLDEDKAINDQLSVGSLSIGTVMIDTNDRILTLEIDHSGRKNGSVPRNKKFKVIFKRGRRRMSGRRPPSQHATTSNCDAQQVQSGGHGTVDDSQSTDRPSAPVNLPRQRSKRGRSFTVLRSRSVSPTGSSTDIQTSENRQNIPSFTAPRPQPIILAYDNADQDDTTV